jgi:inorganic pyrophosphatase
MNYETGEAQFMIKIDSINTSETQVLRRINSIIKWYRWYKSGKIVKTVKWDMNDETGTYMTRGAPEPIF